MKKSVFAEIKGLEKWQKLLLITIAAIVLIRIGYIAFRGEVDKAYEDFGAYDLSEAVPVECRELSQEFAGNNEYLNSLELIFDNIPEDRQGKLILSIFADEDLLYMTNISLTNINNREWRKIFVNAYIDAQKKYKLTLTASEDCTQAPDALIVKNDHAPAIISSEAGGAVTDGQLAVNYEWIRFPGPADRAVMISLWLLFLVFSAAAIVRIDSLTGAYQIIKTALLNNVKEQTAATIIEVIACTVIIGSSGIVFQEPTKVILYIISLIAALKIKDKSEYTASLADTPGKKALLIALYLYAAFSLTGERIWLYPLNSRLTAAGLAVYAAAVIWFVPVIRSLLYYSDKAGRIAFSDGERSGTIRFAAVMILILIIPAAYNLFAYNPGISSGDTARSMIHNAMHLRGMYNWHPFFYCLVLRALLGIWNSTYMIILVQYFFYAYVVTEILLYLRSKGIKDPILIAAALFTGFNAANYLHINTIWKDIPYTLSLLWAFAIITKLVTDTDLYHKKRYIYLELIISLTGICLYRKNGTVTFILIALSLIPLIKRNVRILVSLVLSILIVLTVNGPLCSYFEVESPGIRGIYNGLGQDVLGAYYFGGEVSDDTLKIITNMTDYNNAEFSYIPTWSMQTYDVYVQPVDFVKSYISTFLRNPILMIRAVTVREDALWDIYAGDGATLECVNFTDTLDPDELNWGDYYPARKFVSLYPEASAASAYTADSQWISAIEWRCGVFTLLGLTAILFLILKKCDKHWWILLSPIAGHILSLLLSTGWSDFRYFWPVNLLNLFFLPVMLVLLKERKDEPIR